MDGTDAAREFLRSRGIPEPKRDPVWEAIALHTTPGIPQFMRSEIALTNAAVLVDVVGIGYDEYTPEQRDAVIAACPRGDNFKNDFLRANAPRLSRVNLCSPPDQVRGMLRWKTLWPPCNTWQQSRVSPRNSGLSSIICTD